MCILEHFSYTHPFTPQYLLSTYYVQSTLLGMGDTVASDTVQCPGCWGAGVLGGGRSTIRNKILSEWMATLEKIKWNDSTECPRRHHHRGCPQAWVLSGHSRSQHENTNRKNVTAPRMWSHEHILPLKHNRWNLDMYSPNLPSKHSQEKLHNTACLFYYLF